MSKIYCDGETALDCFRCGKYYTSNSYHYDPHYDCHIVDITCGIGGYRVFKDEDDDKSRIR